MIKMIDSVMTTADEFDRFNGLTFDDFRRLAKDSELSRHEKVGFPISYREGKEKIIFSDTVEKLRGLGKKNGTDHGDWSRLQLFASHADKAL